GIKNPKRITVDEAKEVTAVFDKEVYHISTSVVGSGTVSVSPNKKTYSYNEEVTFTATADDNYEFIQWDGSINSGENPLTINITNDVSLEAVFKTPQEALVSSFYPRAIIGDRIYNS